MKKGFDNELYVKSQIITTFTTKFQLLWLNSIQQISVLKIRFGMRRIIKRLLKKYNYPPEGQETALETIMTQCEMWSDNNIWDMTETNLHRIKSEQL